MKKRMKLVAVILTFVLFGAMALGSGSDSSSSDGTSSAGSPGNSDSKVEYTLSDETIVDNDQCVFRIVEVNEKSGVIIDNTGMNKDIVKFNIE